MLIRASRNMIFSIRHMARNFLRSFLVEVFEQNNVIISRHSRNVFKYIYGSHKCEHHEIIFIHWYMWSVVAESNSEVRLCTRDLLFIFLSINDNGIVVRSIYNITQLFHLFVLETDLVKSIRRRRSLLCFIVSERHKFILQRGYDNALSIVDQIFCKFFTV